MYSCVFIIFSLLLLLLETTVALGGGEDNGVMNKCFSEERHALLDFKARVQDPNGRLSTWRAEEDDCCIWLGVTCNNQSHITGLNIGSYGLAGEISYSLLNLSQLNRLDLSYNSFPGAIPTFIGSLTQLRYLNLGSSNFNGTIPSSIGSLTELRYLDLSVNSLNGTIPPQFGNLTNLQKLYLRSVGRCRVENIEWLSHLSHLEELQMKGISLAKANNWVDAILSLRNLSYLSLERCELSKVMYPYSSLLNSSSSSLDTLSLEENSLTSSMYSWLFPLTANNNLSKLSLSSNMLDGIPAYLGNLCSLKTLQFNNNSAVVKLPEFLKNLSGCTSLSLQEFSAVGSQFTGSVSDDILKFSTLSILFLSRNLLNGTISEKLWELPNLFNLDISSNHLRGAISENIGKSMILIIDLAKNLLEGVPFPYHMSNSSYVRHIDLNSCKLGPHFPKWIQTLKNLTHLDIANNGISDTIPVEFWDTWPSRLGYLNLSSNNISGEVPDLSSNFELGSVIDLSSNGFYGPIPNVSSTLQILNLSRNKFHGGVSFICQIVGEALEYLDLSYNFLSGNLPDCLWNFKQLTILNLENNRLSGKVPPSIGSLIQLEALYLYNNDFSGELPLSLKNCTSLNALNIGHNKFSGDVPVWIGENLSQLFVLNLGSNNFIGTIPRQLCRLAKLQILDLSENHLHGTIPSCLNNLTSMVQERFSQVPNVHYYSLYFLAHRFDGIYLDHAMIEWQGTAREFVRSNLVLLKSIDLSSNNLTGPIPYEVTSLHEMVALNLSRNALVGEIPPEIGQMNGLLALDVSRNNISGQIPTSMSQMTSLSYLDMSSNNLSGRIPSSTQLQSFEPSRYNGNPGLCGPPLTNNCPGDEESKVPPVVGESDGDEFWRWFYIGGGTGFVTAFSIACGALLVYPRGRRAFFHFFDSAKDWIYVKGFLSPHIKKTATNTMGGHFLRCVNQEGLDNYFTLKIYHGGIFTRSPGRRYIDGQIDYVDFVDIDLFSTLELDAMIQELGYVNDELTLFHHYLIPGVGLDLGLLPLVNDADVHRLAQYVGDNKEIKVYIEDGVSRVNNHFISPTKVVIKQLENVISPVVATNSKKRKDGSSSSRSLDYSKQIVPFGTKLVVDVDDGNDATNSDDGELSGGVANLEDIEGFNDATNMDGDAFSGGVGNGEDEFGDSDTDAVSTGEDEDSSHEDEFSDKYLMAEVVGEDDNVGNATNTRFTQETVLEDVEVNMTNFNIDLDDIPDNTHDEEMVEEHSHDEEVEVLDNELFESAVEEQDPRKRMLKAILKQGPCSSGEVYKKAFVVGQAFKTKEDAKAVIAEYSVKERRDLHYVKNDKKRLRVKCRGEILELTGESSKGKGKLVHSKEKSCSWTLLISRAQPEAEWIVTTYIDEHTCCKSRKVRACSYQYLAKEIVQQVEGNPRIPAKALQNDVTITACLRQWQSTMILVLCFLFQVLNHARFNQFGSIAGKTLHLNHGATVQVTSRNKRWRKYLI